AERPSFVRSVDEALQAVGDLGKRLWVEFDIDGERQVAGALGPLAEVLRRHGTRVGIRRVAAPPEDMGLLRRLGVAYLRLAHGLCTGLAGDGSAGKRLLLQVMAELGESEGLRVLAGEAASDADARLLRQLGLPCAEPAVVQAQH
ncbi:MAG: EAL domain-containing protein, partial [Rubrivivax sp.]